MSAPSFSSLSLGSELVPSGDSSLSLEVIVLVEVAVETYYS